VAKRQNIKTEVSGVKVGIVGLTTPTTSYRAAPHLQKSITYSDPFVAAKNAVKELKSQGCDFIIALSHLGYQSDMELSAQVTGLNLIVGGEIGSYDDKLITLMSLFIVKLRLVHGRTNRNLPSRSPGDGEENLKSLACKIYHFVKSIPELCPIILSKSLISCPSRP